MCFVPHATFMMWRDVSFALSAIVINTCLANKLSGWHLRLAMGSLLELTFSIDYYFCSKWGDLR